MIKHLLLIFAFFASMSASAQEQNNALLNRLLDKVQQLHNEVTELRNQNELTQFELRTLKKNLDRQLSELETQTPGSSTTMTVRPRSIATVATETQLEQLKNNSQRLEQKIARTNNRLDELARIVKELQPQTPGVVPVAKPEVPAIDLEVPVVAPEVPVAEPQVPAVAPEVPAAEPQVPTARPSLIGPAGLPDEAEYAAYSKAMAALERADYTRLRDNLTRFLQDYPEGDYADDANYWVAESYYAEGDLEQATSYFTQLLENYDNSEKRESALLKIAYIRLNKEQWEDARKILERLKNEAEDEAVRKLAIEQLQQLGNEGR